MGFNSNTTLMQALNFGGGPGPQGAALLKAASEGVDYPLTVGQVTTMVNDALATGQRSTMLYLASQLDYYNNLSCPLPGRPAMQNEQDVLREELRRLEE